MREIYLKISGRVQGVGFRRWTERQAQKIGDISGWVRNAEDGSVEIFMRGADEKIEQMVLSCYHGPLLARVDNVAFLPERTNFFLPPFEDGVFERI